MNENIDLTKILKNCPEGTVLWSDNFGKVEFSCINTYVLHPIMVKRTDGQNVYYTKEGWHNINFPSNCLLWPSKDCRDWSKFTAPWYKKEKFDPRTLKPFDKVLVFDSDRPWTPLMFSYLEYSLNYPRMECFDFAARKVIPYNKETEHLVGTYNEASEYYKYWED